MLEHQDIRLMIFGLVAVAGCHCSSNCKTGSGSLGFHMSLFELLGLNGFSVLYGRFHICCKGVLLEFHGSCLHRLVENMSVVEIGMND